MNIILDDMAVMLKTSPGTIITIKKKLGFPKGYKTTEKDLPIIKAEVKKIQKGCGKRNPNKENYYLEAMAIIKRDGIITAEQLNRIFKVSNVALVETYFENKKTPIYHEWIQGERKNKYKSRKIKIFKLFSDIKAQWKEENRTNGLYNNTYSGNPSSKLF